MIPSLKQGERKEEKRKCGGCKRRKDPKLFYRRNRSPDGIDSICKDCRDSYCNKSAAAITEKNRRRKFPLVYKAYSEMRKAMRSGEIKKSDCFLCGSSKNIEGHHLDYNFPLKVIWLCRDHHREVENYKKLKI